LPNENCLGAYQETPIASLIFVFGSEGALPKGEDAILGISTIARSIKMGKYRKRFAL
jgi:hypothetical protein